MSRNLHIYTSSSHVTFHVELIIKNVYLEKVANIRAGMHTPIQTTRAVPSVLLLIPAVWLLSSKQGGRLCHREYKTNSGKEGRLFCSKHCLPLMLFGWLVVRLLNRRRQKAGQGCRTSFLTKKKKCHFLNTEIIKNWVALNISLSFLHFEISECFSAFIVRESIIELLWLDYVFFISFGL